MGHPLNFGCWNSPLRPRVTLPASLTPAYLGQTLQVAKLIWQVSGFPPELNLKAPHPGERRPAPKEKLGCSELSIRKSHTQNVQKQFQVPTEPRKFWTLNESPHMSPREGESSPRWFRLGKPKFFGCRWKVISYRIASLPRCLNTQLQKGHTTWCEEWFPPPPGKFIFPSRCT